MDTGAAPASTAAAARPADAERRGAARLPLVLTVGFTGHRTLADPAAAAERIGAAFAQVGRAFEIVAAAPPAAAFDGAPALRLAIGGAPGADRVAASAWTDAGLGEVHFVYPYKDRDGDDAFTDDPAHGDPETRVSPAPEFAPWTGFDAAGLGLGEPQAHAEVGRWIVRNADVLVCWWDGEAGRGAGGVHDTVRRALDRGLPVIWLAPAGPGRLIDPERAHRHAEASEAITDVESIAGPLSPEALAATLAPTLFPPAGSATAHSAEVAARLDYGAHDPMRPRPGFLGALQRLCDRTLWRSFGLFERVCGRVAPAPDPTEPPPAAVAAQPGFARLQAEADEAGDRASHLGRVHRSEQLLLILIAIVAVFFGALPALVAGEATPNVHVDAALVEFLLGLLAFAVAATARLAHRHRRWSDARRLAERLRGVLATWPLGFDIADAHAGPPHVWTEWRAQAVLRAAGPRRGWITAARFEETFGWVSRQLIDGQIAYHGRQHRLAETVERTLKAVENGAFGLLMGTLASYIGLTLLGPTLHWSAPHWFGGLVTVVSAVSPAIGAGCIALDATNGFGELRQHSARLAAEFEQLRARIDAADAAYHPALAVIRRGAQLLVEDADAWRDRLQRRRIVRGG